MAVRKEMQMAFLMENWMDSKMDIKSVSYSAYSMVAKLADELADSKVDWTVALMASILVVL